MVAFMVFPYGTDLRRAKREIPTQKTQLEVLIQKLAKYLARTMSNQFFGRRPSRNTRAPPRLVGNASADVSYAGSKPKVIPVVTAATVKRTAETAVTRGPIGRSASSTP